MYLLLDKEGRKLATVGMNPVVIESDDPEVSDMATKGVPARRGVIGPQGMAAQVDVAIKPSDPFWGLAFLEWAEDHDCKVVDMKNEN